MKSLNPQNIRPYQTMLYVLPEFSLTEFAAVLDVLNAVNHVSGCIQYEWKIMSERTHVVNSSSSFFVETDAFADISTAPDLMIFVGGGSCRDSSKLLKSAVHWLKCRNAHVVVLSEAVAALAELGCFNNQKASVHWGAVDSLALGKGDVFLDEAIITESGRITTSGGRVATFDLMLGFLARIHGRDFANLIADYMLKGDIRQNDTPQRRNLRDRLDTSNERVLAAVELMEQNIEDVLTMADIVHELKISQRQLERLFKVELKASPNNYYKSLRLKRANSLLEQTSMSMIDIAICSGFSTASNFSRSYKKMFGQTPLEFRKNSRASMSSTNSPKHDLQMTKNLCASGRMPVDCVT